MRTLWGVANDYTAQASLMGDTLPGNAEGKDIVCSTRRLVAGVYAHRVGLANQLDKRILTVNALPSLKNLNCWKLLLNVDATASRKTKRTREKSYGRDNQQRRRYRSSGDELCVTFDGQPKGVGQPSGGPKQILPLATVR